MAPEVIDPPPDMHWGEETSYDTPPSDVYSFGMTILEVSHQR